MKFSATNFCLLIFVSISFPSMGQGEWQTLPDCPLASVERMFSFTIEGAIYIGGGRDENNVNSTEIWAYEPDTESWIQKNDFPGFARRNAFAFQIDGIGYMGNGYDGDSTLSDFWKYQPEDDIWIQLPDFPGVARNHALAVTMESKGYIIAGGDSEVGYNDDFWEFDADTETWTMLEKIPGESRWRAYGWVIENKIYVGGGSNFLNNGFQDLYAYDIENATWNAKEGCPTDKSIGGYFFTLQNKGYYVEGANQVTTGSYDKRTFVYDPDSDLWEEAAIFIGPSRILGFATTIGNRAIVGMGRNYPDNGDYRDLYIYTSELSTSYQNPSEEEVRVYPNPVRSELSLTVPFRNSENLKVQIYDLMGRLLLSADGHEISIADGRLHLSVAMLEAGIYQLKISTKQGRQSKLITKI